MKIQKNSVVQIHYTLTDDQGEVIDSSAAQGPLPYIHGVGALIPGLEKELEGRQAGDKFRATIAPADGYGEFDPEQVFELPASSFGEDEEIAPGVQVQLDTESGPVIGVITEVDEEIVSIDLNHPLAGVPLHFDVEVVEVRAATPEELAHGHVHGTGHC